MEAHWRDGRDIEDEEDLREIARSAGLSDDAVERSMNDSQYVARIDSIRDEANRIGVEGIPTFILGRYVLSGCQPYEAFEELARRAGAQRQ